MQLSIHFNDQFASLPESTEGYKATVTFYYPQKFTDTEAIGFKPETFNMNVSPNLIGFSFLDPDTADHTVMAFCRDEAKLLESIKEIRTPGEDCEVIEVYINFGGKIAATADDFKQEY